MIPTCYYNKSIIDLIDDQIFVGFDSYSSLEDIEKDRITSQCMKVLGEDAYNCIIDHQDLNKTLSSLQKYILTADMDEGYDLLSILRKNATEYFADVMDELFVERLTENKSISYQEAGYKPIQDKINGEITWRKSA